MTRKYLHDKPPAGISSYQKYLSSEVSKATSGRGFIVDVVDYMAMMPPQMAKVYEMDRYIKKKGLVLVTLQNQGRVIAHLQLDKSFYLGTCKDRNDYDYMIESVECNFLRPLNAALEARAS